MLIWSTMLILHHSEVHLGGGISLGGASARDDIDQKRRSFEIYRPAPSKLLGQTSLGAVGALLEDPPAVDVEACDVGETVEEGRGLRHAVVWYLIPIVRSTCGRQPFLESR